MPPEENTGVNTNHIQSFYDYATTMNITIPDNTYNTVDPMDGSITTSAAISANGIVIDDLVYRPGVITAADNYSSSVHLVDAINALERLDKYKYESEDGHALFDNEEARNLYESLIKYIAQKKKEEHNLNESRLHKIFSGAKNVEK